MADFTVRQLTRASCSSTKYQQTLDTMQAGMSSERFARLYDSTPETFRLQNELYIVAGLDIGEVWIAESVNGAVLGVAMWAGPGSIPADSEDFRSLSARIDALLTAEQQAFAAARKRVTEQRNARFPTLWRDSYHLHFLATDAAHRGKGIASAVLAPVLSYAREHGQELSLLTHSESNRRFYTQRGFQTVWETKMVHPDGQEEPYIVMTMTPARHMPQPDQEGLGGNGAS